MGANQGKKEDNQEKIVAENIFSNGIQASNWKESESAIQSIAEI